jgi:ATP-dependent 26S proteasome regulatory subunit
MTDSQLLGQLYLSQHPCVSIQSVEEDAALTVVRDMALEAGIDLWIWSSSHGLREGLLNQSAALPDTEPPAGALYQLSTLNKTAVMAFLDLGGHLRDEKTLRMLRDLIHRCTVHTGMVVLIDGHGDLPPAVRAVATTLDLSLPDEKELEQVVRAALRQRNEMVRIQVDLDRKGFDAILRNLRGLTARQARQVVLDSISEDQRFDISDVNKILAEKRKQFQSVGLLEYVEAPVDLSEIGGLFKLKEWLKQRENSLSDEATAFGIPAPRGMLMLGMQGAGKSLSAKAVATSWQRPLLRLDVGALYDKYIGESEKRLKDALRQAEMMSPIVLWIDEIEKGFASAAAQSTDGGLSKRMFGSLLTWMQEHRAPVFLVATANDIEALPPELLRKGRFDEIFFVDLPNLEARRQILEIHITKRKREPEHFDLDSLAEACAGFSGAEIEQAIISALCEAFSKGQELETSHIQRAIKKSPPLSVTMSERIEALREWASGRCVPAD